MVTNCSLTITDVAVGVTSAWIGWYCWSVLPRVYAICTAVISLPPLYTTVHDTLTIPEVAIKSLHVTVGAENEQCSGHNPNECIHWHSYHWVLY